MRTSIGSRRKLSAVQLSRDQVTAELNGADLRREPIEVRKATLASVLRPRRPGLRLNEHLTHPEGDVVFRHACALGLEGIVSKRLGSSYRLGALADWLKFKNPAAPAVRGRRKRIGVNDGYG